MGASLSGDITALPRGTPLYGQPSWWGDGDADDENSFKQESKSSSKKHDSSISGRTNSDFSLKATVPTCASPPRPSNLNLPYRKLYIHFF